ncbi:aldehyde dehydrogenase family protein [Citricoccus sp. SGAir0253]|uniref:aldehyde dehydrogenase family protein n=1 Tax=Citricoccus sp. SGAir0253 TaxID=2567881 RepID=UPI0010CCB22D|nr:aldehyde dehydrogenase family protein [Citricoccus sp. SGAir0253]QCU77179.1 aldehyde dehydrogenase family protein [Citricoccus sp. SGAir0253]
MTATYEVIDPATLEPVGDVPLHQPEDVERAITAAQGAGRAWAADREARRAALRSAADAVDAEAGDLGRILSLEQGKVLAEAVQEFRVAAGLLRHYADLDWAQSETLPPRDGRQVQVQYAPVGLVGAITPWNFPISLLAVKLAPALVAGCTVVAKPSPSTPMSTRALAEVLNRFLPEGVLQVVTGRGVLSRALSEMPGVRKISFTGSTEIGAAIMAQAAPTVKKVTLELGGNDPAIVLPDADLEVTAQRIVASAFRNAGQVCMAVKRVYAPRELGGALTEALVAAAAALRVGHGVAEGTTMGPMHTSGQQQLVKDYVAQAVAQGGRIAHGGEHGTSLPGYFLEPTIVADAPAGSELVSCEQFGAALPVVAYDDLDATIEALNAQEFGLGASVWSPDLHRAHEVASRLEVGTAWINQHTVVELDAPFGGWKGSGLGRERGRWGLEEYLEPRTVNARAHTD